jgi:hypothetical protein
MLRTKIPLMPATAVKIVLPDGMGRFVEDVTVTWNDFVILFFSGCQLANLVRDCVSDRILTIIQIQVSRFSLGFAVRVSDTEDWVCVPLKADLKRFALS